jgi:hypothetical protein
VSVKRGISGATSTIEFVLFCWHALKNKEKPKTLMQVRIVIFEVLFFEYKSNAFLKKKRIF